MKLLIQNARVRGRAAPADILVEDGRIARIDDSIDLPCDRVLDAEGGLVTPAFLDPHIHLDKVNVFDTVRPNESGTLKEAIEILWEKKRRYTVEDIVDRAGEVVRRAVVNGTLGMRTHVDVDTIGGLMPLEGVLALREKYRALMDIQIVAFPQEGICKDPGCDRLMERAMERGADIVGGMPANEASPADSMAHVKFCFDLAEEYGAEIDMHVDETDDPFFRTLEMIADEAMARNFAPGRVTAGHTCALAAYDDHYAAYVIDKVRAAGLNIITNPVTNLMLQGRSDRQPIRRGITRVKELLAAGVTVCFGQDCIKDTFYPYGSADMLQVANVTAHAAQMSLPGEIETLLDMITTHANRILKLPGYGLEPGGRADLVVTPAADARDAVRLCPPRRWVIREGRVVAGSRVEQFLEEC